MGRMDLDSVLSEATHAARYFTDSTGAALALWSQGVVICRARSGDTAPPLGAKLDMDSGVSGECLRSGRSKRCNDTLTDPLVDAHVCQELGIRSLAAVPLRGDHGVIGILEVFSDRPYAFSDAHITLLKQLAQIAVTGRSRSVPASSPANPAPPPVVTSTESRPARPPMAVKPSPFAILVARMKGEEGQPYRLAAGGLLLLVVLGGVAWMSLRSHGSTNGSAQSVQAASNSTVPPLMAADTAAESSLTISPSLTVSSSRNRGTSTKNSADAGAKNLIRRASNSEVMDRRDPETDAITPVPDAQPASAAEDVPAPDAVDLRASAGEAPKILMGSQPALPAVALRMSQGVSGGSLAHRVTPIYPQQARQLRVEGAVTLDATVGEDGNVHEVKVLKGDRILAQAASDAVRQWRYQPFQLNGKPISMHTQITIQFKLP